MWKAIISSPSTCRYAVSSFNSQDEGFQLPDVLSHIQNPFEAYKDLCNLSVFLDQHKQTLGQDIISVSSEDHANQSARNMLIKSSSRFWSSEGSSDKNSSEFFTMSLGRLCCISGLYIKPYCARFQIGLPIYAPQSVIVMVGFSPDQFHFVSPPIQIRNVNGKLDRLPHL